MVRHIILWKLRDGLSDKETIKAQAKENLEGLCGKIDGLITLTLTTDRLPSSNADMMLYSEFRDEAALALYAASPVHNAVADKYVRPYTEQRLCIDF